MTASFPEYFGVATGLLYLYLEIRQRRSVWIVGIVSAGVYVYVFFDSKVYANMLFNLYYVFISLYGLRQWSRNKTSEEANGEGGIVYRHLTLPLLGVLLLVLAAVGGGAYGLLAYFTDSSVPLGDAFTAAAGVVATWMLARRIIEHWLFWIVSDLVSVYLYGRLGLYPTMGLYFCYAAMAGVGYRVWKARGTVCGDL